MLIAEAGLWMGLQRETVKKNNQPFSFSIYSGLVHRSFATFFSEIAVSMAYFSLFLPSARGRTSWTGRKTRPDPPRRPSRPSSRRCSRRSSSPFSSNVHNIQNIVQRSP